MRTTLYLHGFLSRPDSNKGRLLRQAHEAVGKPFIAPELYMSPYQVADLLTDLVQRYGAENLDVVGSSLGGFYSAWATEKFGLSRTVLLNPALGNWGKVNFTPGYLKIDGSEKQMYVGPNFLQELEAMLVTEFSAPQNILTLLSLKDEVLDHRVTKKMLARTQIIEIPEGDHRITHFEPFVDPILNFLTKA